MCTDKATMEIKIQRAMAWERAKGELGSILQTFYGEKQQFEDCSKTFHAFIKDVEDYGFVE